jgi:Flp pilus assembly protein TadD
MPLRVERRLFRTLQEAERLMMFGNFQAASEMLRALRAASGPLESIDDLLATCCSMTGDETGELRYSELLVHHDQNNYHYWYNLGCTLKSGGNRGLARSCFETAVKLNPGHEPSVFSLGTLAVTVDEARTLFARAALIDPTDPDAERALAALTAT